jgi:hypothetical protein
MPFDCAQGDKNMVIAPFDRRAAPYAQGDKNMIMAPFDCAQGDKAKEIAGYFLTNNATFST